VLFFIFCFLLIQWKQFKCIIILFENSTWLLDRLCHFKCLIRKHMCDGIVTLWECSLYDFLKTLFRKSKMVDSTGKSFNTRLYRNMNGFSQNQNCTGSWLYHMVVGLDYLCNQCLSLLTLWVQIPLRRGGIDTTLKLYDKSLSVTYDWLVVFFSPGALVSSTNKADCHDIRTYYWKWL
jgi:hypothetical protein